MLSTHVAGLISSLSYSVCQSNSVAIKVLNCEGSGTTMSVIKGIEYAHNHLLTQTNKKGIINMSLGGGFSKVLNTVIEKVLQNKNMFVVTAAGNENQDYHNTSPASAKNTFVVMASDSNLNRAYFSNYNGIFYSPGVNILSSYINNSTKFLSGTSMATPIFTSVLTHYINKYPELSQKQLLKVIKKHFLKNVVEHAHENPNYYVQLE